MTNATCSVDGCDRVSGRTKGLCPAHYTRLQRHGDVQADKPLQKRAGAPSAACSVDGCDTIGRTRGLCGAHYSRLRKYGDVRADEPVANWYRPTEECSVEACERDAVARGMCNGHYERIKYYGDANPDRPLKSEIIPGKSWCSQCEQLLPLSHFYASTKRKSGADPYCVQCKKRLARTKYRDAIKAGTERWRKANAEKMREYQQAYLDRYPERRKMSIITYGLNRRSRLEENGGSASSEQVDQRWDYYGRRCWVCGDDADSTDHVKPVSKGGTGWPANLRPICRSCNSVKSNTWPYPLEVARGRSTPRREITPRAA